LLFKTWIQENDKLKKFVVEKLLIYNGFDLERLIVELNLEKEEKIFLHILKK
jgi:hypothetical protein